jgi:methylated-DNA-[protein]-cysteine S-methyltransferase
LKLDDTIYELVSKIPEGKVTTYAELAKAIGKPNASRLIGQILNRNPNPIVVPCHRVVMSNGVLGGYAYGSDAKRKLLEKDGVRTEKGRIADFKNVKHRFSANRLL